jgi:hypothetical protein
VDGPATARVRTGVARASHWESAQVPLIGSCRSSSAVKEPSSRDRRLGAPCFNRRSPPTGLPLRSQRNCGPGCTRRRLAARHQSPRHRHLGRGRAASRRLRNQHSQHYRERRHRQSPPCRLGMRLWLGTSIPDRTGRGFSPPRWGAKVAVDPQHHRVSANRHVTIWLRGRANCLVPSAISAIRCVEVPVNSNLRRLSRAPVTAHVSQPQIASNETGCGVRYSGRVNPATAHRRSRPQPGVTAHLLYSPAAPSERMSSSRNSACSNRRTSSCTALLTGAVTTVLRRLPNGSWIPWMNGRAAARSDRRLPAR